MRTYFGCPIRGGGMAAYAGSVVGDLRVTRTLRRSVCLGFPASAEWQFHIPAVRPGGQSDGIRRILLPAA